MATQQEIDGMRLAIALSAWGLGTASPNPPVGCVILDVEGEIVGSGFHERKGEPHAEGHALKAAGPRATGGTAVVTLEPCNHTGLTPACRQLLLDAQVARVVIAVLDPTSRAEGGAAALKAAGVGVEVGVLAEEARLVLGSWLFSQEFGRPVVTAVHTTGDEVGPPVSSEILDELRVTVDAVVFEDGRVEEGVSGSHGQHGVFELPPRPIRSAPGDVLRALSQGGVRSALLVGGPEFVEQYASAGLLDRVITYLPATDQSVSRPHVSPAGFRLTKVSRTGEYVRLDLATLGSRLEGASARLVGAEDGRTPESASVNSAGINPCRPSAAST